MGETSIEWTNKVWNPIRGCSLVSSGCTNCYAMKQAHRFSGPGQPYEGLTRLGARGPTWTGEVRTVPDALDVPFRWQKPCKVFVNSMSDLFHEDVPEEFIAVVFAVMGIASAHTYQVLTKRPDRMAEVVSRLGWDDCVKAFRLQYPRNGDSRFYCSAWPLPNVWLGASVEDQATANERIPHLLRVPAAVRFLSCEPLLGPVDLTHFDNGGGETYNALTAEITTHRGHRFRTSDTETLNWIIVGGESGPKARMCDIEWIRSLVGQCQAAGVSAFVKQLGSEPYRMNWPILTPRSEKRAITKDISYGMIRDPKGGDWDEWPQDLRVRQFPRTEVGASA